MGHNLTNYLIDNDGDSYSLSINTSNVEEVERMCLEGMIWRYIPKGQHIKTFELDSPFVGSYDSATKKWHMDKEINGPCWVLWDREIRGWHETIIRE